MYANLKDKGYFNNHNFIGLFGDIKDLNTIVSDLDSIKIKNTKVKKIINNKDYFDYFGINSDILNKKYDELCYSDRKIIMLMKVCSLKPDVIVLNNFDLGFNYKIKSKISKFIKYVNASDKTCFIIISNDVLFINKCAKHIIISNNKIIKYQGDIISAIKQGLLDKPPIIKFIDLANNKKANLDYTLDGKELLKAIYRSVF